MDFMKIIRKKLAQQHPLRKIQIDLDFLKLHQISPLHKEQIRKIKKKRNENAIIRIVIPKVQSEVEKAQKSRRNQRNIKSRNPTQKRVGRKVEKGQKVDLNF